MTCSWEPGKTFTFILNTDKCQQAAKFTTNCNAEKMLNQTAGRRSALTLGPHLDRMLGTQGLPEGKEAEGGRPARGRVEAGRRGEGGRCGE